MNDHTMNMHHNMIEGNRFRSRLDEDDDLCNECEGHPASHCCNKCANSICDSDKCSWLFPHYKRTSYVICSSCVEAIDKKLTVLVDYSKLVLLKKKIHKKLNTTINTLNK
jgi:hypothetical protein